MMESEDTSINSGLLNEDDRLDGMVLGGASTRKITREISEELTTRRQNFLKMTNK